MVFIIKKDDDKKVIEEAVSKLEKKPDQPRLSDFYGKLKGKFEDGMIYQKKVRDEWS